MTVSNSYREKYLKGALLHWMMGAAPAGAPNTRVTLTIGMAKDYFGNQIDGQIDIGDEEIIAIMRRMGVDGAVTVVEVPMVTPRFSIRYVDVKAYVAKQLEEGHNEFVHVRDLDREFLSEVLQKHPYIADPVEDLANEALVPASDRYVSTHDNAELVDVALESLEKVKQEFASDHNKEEYKEISGPFTELVSEIDAVKAQSKYGVIRRGLLKFIAVSLKRLMELAKAWPGLEKMLKAAWDAITGWLGLS